MLQLMWQVWIVKKSLTLPKKKGNVCTPCDCMTIKGVIDNLDKKLPDKSFC